MEEFVIRNYLYYNLRDILSKMNKIYPDIITDKILSFELSKLLDHVSSVKDSTVYTGCNAIDSTTNSQISKSSNIPILDLSNTFCDLLKNKNCKAQVPLTQNSKPIAPVAIELPFEAYNPVHTVRTEKNATESILNTHETKEESNVIGMCAARVITSSRTSKSCDYMSYSKKSKNPSYGRQCKNIKMDNSIYCGIHNKKCEYGKFDEEPCEAIKEICLKKYYRCKQVEDSACNPVQTVPTTFN